MMKIETKNRYTKVILIDNCNFDVFYKIAAVLKSALQTDFTNKLNDTDSIFWDFVYKDTQLVLHYSTYLGISIFPQNVTSATSIENRTVIEVSEILGQRLEEIDSEKNYISKFFKDPPIKWGLRGDPHLWAELRETTRKRKYPSQREN